MTCASPVRKYAMTRLGPGDYLLPSNDGATLWRIYSYREDGSAEWGDGTKIIGTFWAAAKYEKWIHFLEDLPDDFLEWHHWQTWVTTQPTRQDAIDEALR